MRFRLIVTCVSVFVAVTMTTVPVAFAPQNNGQANASTDNTLVVQQMAAMPLAFTENKGQWDERVRFRSSAGGATLWFCRDGITYQFTHRVPRSNTADTEPLAAGVAPRAPFDRAERFMPNEAEADSTETVVIHAAFAGRNAEVELAGENLLEYRCNYFLGNDQAKWQTDVPNYAAVVYRNVYPGVDVRYEGKGGALTCSYTAASESDLAQVKFQYQGFDSAHPNGHVAVTETGFGQLRVEALWGAVLEPLSSGQAGGQAGNVEDPPDPVSAPGRGARGAAPVATSTCEANGATSVTLVYSTYLGGGYNDDDIGIAVDQAGSAYVTGTTGSSDFPTQNPYDGTSNGWEDVFVTKLSSAGNALVYSTYLGGSADDCDYGGIAVDQAGSAYVTGYTDSPDFPTQNPYDGTFNEERDAFVTKLSPAGNALVYSTYLGGTDREYGYGIAVDQAGSAYVTGNTWSSDFPTQNPYDGTSNGDYDAFVTKLSPAGNALVYSTYLGGNYWDESWSIAVDQAGSAYVTGNTHSIDFPTQNPYDGSLSGGIDVFVTKLSPAGNTLVYSTYLGGSGFDWGLGIAVDQAGSAYVTGYTWSSDFPTQNPYDGTSNGYYDAFVVKLDSTSCMEVASPDPTSLNPVDGSSGSMDCLFAWDSVIAADWYQIQIDTSQAHAFTGVLWQDTIVSEDSVAIGVPPGQVWWRVRSLTECAASGWTSPAVYTDVDLSTNSDVPVSYQLLQNYPNPFNAGTVIEFRSGTFSDWTLSVYNIMGQAVRTFDGSDATGTIRVEWDGKSGTGKAVASGVYFCRVTTPSWSATKKLTLLK